MVTCASTPLNHGRNHLIQMRDLAMVLAEKSHREFQLLRYSHQLLTVTLSGCKAPGKDAAGLPLHLPRFQRLTLMPQDLT